MKKLKKLGRQIKKSTRKVFDYLEFLVREELEAMDNFYKGYAA